MKEIARLRNPSDSPDALKLGNDAERFIGEALDKCGVPRRKFSAQDIHRAARVGENERALMRMDGEDPDTPDLLAWRAGGSFEETLDRAFIDNGFDPLDEAADLPEEFWPAVASKRTTPHLDFLIAHRAGMLHPSERYRAESAVRALASILWKWPGMAQLTAKPITAEKAEGGKPKRKRKMGRPKKTDSQRIADERKDRRIAERWEWGRKSGKYVSKKDLAEDLGKSVDEVKDALERDRKRVESDDRRFGKK